jgi:hypothetical protein
MARYDLTRFRATHNSYSGEARGTLPHQLGLKIRHLELDFHDNGYQEFGDYRVGHLKVGSEVALGNGNPSTLLLRDWLGVIASWSSQHPGHAPITITLDAKDDLTDNPSGGDLEDLNGTLVDAFGTKLFTREDYDQAGAWPDVAALRDRFLCVLSGHGSTRAAYRWAFGVAPALAVNAGGDVVLAYRSSAGDLNCWIGVASAATANVSWQRKATYAIGQVGLQQPALGINDDGWIVAVHRFGPLAHSFGPLLESVVGRLQDDGRIAWFGARTFARGTAPSLQMRGDDVREIHTMTDGQRREQIVGRLNRRKRRVDWQSPAETQAQPFPRDVARFGAHEVRCSSNAGAAIVCSVDGGAAHPLRFHQVAFVEMQKGDDGEPAFGDALFFAADAKNKTAIAQARLRGLVARAWGFDDGDQTNPPTPPQENSPATDDPEEPWYGAYMTGADVAD